MIIQIFKFLLLISILTKNNAWAGSAGFNFQSTTLYSGPVQPGFGSGISAFDFDQDGDVDIFIPTAAGEFNKLLVNQGDGSFIDSAALYGLADTRIARSAIWMDYEGDGDFDLLIARDCYQSTCDPLLPIISLLENNLGQFTEVTTAVGLFVAVSTLNPNNNQIGGLSVGDLNNDGLPDIYLPIWQTKPLLFFSGDFNVTKHLQKGDPIGGYLNAGELTTVGSLSAGHWQALFHDFNNDHMLDLFVNVDFHANQLWINQGISPYTNIAISAGVDSMWNEMGLAAGDYDSDGDIDLYITNIYGWLGQNRTNRLYRNDTIGNSVSFTDTAINMAVDDTDWGWGATWFDAENDGDLDLAVTNGYCQPAYCDAQHQFDQSRLFVNPSDGSAFLDASIETGFNDTDVGASLVKADFNADGLIDLLQTVVTSANVSEVRLLTNSSNLGNSYLKIQLEGINLAGSVITLSNENRQQAHLVTQGNSYLGQEPMHVQFGLGNTNNFYELTVIWPDGLVSFWGKSWFKGSALEPMLVNRAHIFSHGFE